MGVVHRRCYRRAALVGGPFLARHHQLHPTTEGGDDTMASARECRGPWPRLQIRIRNGQRTRDQAPADSPRSHTHGEPGPPASGVTSTSTRPRAGPARRTVRAAVVVSVERTRRTRCRTFRLTPSAMTLIQTSPFVNCDHQQPFFVVF